MKGLTKKDKIWINKNVKETFTDADRLASDLLDCLQMKKEGIIKKKLISCPRCELKGKKNILGEIDGRGHFVVLRFHSGTTKIISKNLTVVCDKCNEPIYVRREHEQTKTN